MSEVGELALILLGVLAFFCALWFWLDIFEWLEKTAKAVLGAKSRENSKSRR